MFEIGEKVIYIGDSKKDLVGEHTIIQVSYSGDYVFINGGIGFYKSENFQSSRIVKIQKIKDRINGKAVVNK